MSLELFQWIKDLVTTNPAGTDPKSQGDDHIRGIKATLKNTFPNFTEGKAITLTESQLNALVTDYVQKAGDTMSGQLTILADGSPLVFDGTESGTEIMLRGRFGATQVFNIGYTRAQKQLALHAIETGGAVLFYVTASTVLKLTQTSAEFSVPISATGAITVTKAQGGDWGGSGLILTDATNNNPSISFHAAGVSFASILRLDGPGGIFRFLDASGSNHQAVACQHLYLAATSTNADAAVRYDQFTSGLNSVSGGSWSGDIGMTGPGARTNTDPRRPMSVFVAGTYNDQPMRLAMQGQVFATVSAGDFFTVPPGAAYQIGIESWETSTVRESLL